MLWLFINPRGGFCAQGSRTDIHRRKETRSVCLLIRLRPFICAQVQQDEPFADVLITKTAKFQKEV